MISCKQCSETFCSVGARRVHTRAVHQEFCTIRQADGTKHRVQRSASMGWVCPHPSCSLALTRPHSLQTHYSSLHVRQVSSGIVREERSDHGSPTVEGSRLTPPLTTAQNEEVYHGRPAPGETPLRNAQDEDQEGHASEGTPNSESVRTDGVTAHNPMGPDTSVRPDEVETPEILSRASFSVVKYRSMTLLYCKRCDGMVDGSKGKSVCNHVGTHFRVNGGEQSGSGGPLRSRRSLRGRFWKGSELNDLEAAANAIRFTPLQNLRHFLFGTTVVPQIPLLTVHDGLGCSLCHYHGVDRKVMGNHKRLKHMGEGTEGDDDSRFYTCKVQTLVRGYGIKYFAVECPSQPLGCDPNPGRWEAFLAKISAIKETIRPNRDPPPRQLSPWLRKSKWCHFATQMIPEDANFGDIKGAMEACKTGTDPYCRVNDVLRGYAGVLRNEVLDKAEFKVRKLVALDSVKGFTEFMSSKTILQYLPVMKGFVLALLHSACNRPSNLVHVVVAPEHLKEDLRAFRRQLESLRQDPIQEGFDYRITHKLLLGLWTPKHCSKMVVQRSKDCLFVQFMILFSLRPCREGTTPSYSWMSIAEVTRMLSMLKFWCRATIEMEICRKLWNPSAGDMDVDDVEKLLVYTDESEILRETPFSYISLVQKLACSMVGDAPVRPQLLSSEPTSCNIGGYDITLDNVRSMIKALICDCITIMREEVLLGLNTDWIQQLLDEGAPILDAMNREAYGYSFVTDKRNPFHKHENDLFRHMFDRGMSQYVSGHDAEGRITDFNHKTLGLWMNACTRLEDLLGVLLHMTSSQPPRAKEYESFLIKNTATGDRGFFWSEETLVIFQVYNKKDSGPKGKPKLIVRFLPHCLRRGFLEYLSLVRPVQVAVAAILWNGGVAALYQDLWFVRMGCVNTTVTLSRIMKREFLAHCGAPIGLKDYRHVVTFFSEPIREEVKALQGEPLDDAAGHCGSTAGRCYAQNASDLRCVGRNRWRAFKFVAEKLHQLYDLPLHQSDIRRSPPPRMPGSIVHRTPRDVTATTPQDEFQFLPRHVAKRRRLFQGSEGESKGRDVLELIDSNAMHWAEAALEHFGYTGWKTSQQGVAVAMVLDNCRDFIAILPTGSGKSLTFMAAARMSGKTVVVIVPLLMLIKKQVAECKARRITCDEFRADKIDPADPPQVVFVPVEIAVSESFQIWARQLISASRLHSIFVDEVHLVLANYRHKMSQLYLLSCLNCQMIGLTASLSPDEEIQVKSTLGRDFIVIRSKTTRPNLEYSVLDVNDMDADIAKRLEEWLATDRASEDRALVYCMTRYEVESLHKYLKERNVPSTFLHARIEPQEDKVERLQTWEVGTVKIMVATSVLGCGYDYPAVRLVLHRGSFFTLAGYHQESGRGGRDGKRTICQVISKPGYRRSMENLAEKRASVGRAGGNNDVLLCMKKANRWIEAHNLCRRLGLHEELDGEAEVCIFLPAAAKCDVCSRKSKNFASHGGRTRNGACDALSLEDFVPPEVTRPACTRRDRNKLENLQNLARVKELAGDGTDCLLCAESHKPQRCPKNAGRCLRCFALDHTVHSCPIKKSMQGYVFKQCCHRCYFQLDSIGKETVHKWIADDTRNCNDLSGERIRTLIWSAYRCDPMYTTLRRHFPGMPSEDISLERWLVEKESDHLINNFVRVAATVLDMDR